MDVSIDIDKMLKPSRRPSASALNVDTSGATEHGGMDESVSPPPALLLLAVLALLGLLRWWQLRLRSGSSSLRQPRPQLSAAARHLWWLRRLFALHVVLVMAWSYVSLGHLMMCDDAGERCHVQRQHQACADRQHRLQTDRGSSQPPQG